VYCSVNVTGVRKSRVEDQWGIWEFCGQARVTEQIVVVINLALKL
jgi:hypothetical protein